MASAGLRRGGFDGHLAEDGEHFEAASGMPAWSPRSLVISAGPSFVSTPSASATRLRDIAMRVIGKRRQRTGWVRPAQRPPGATKLAITFPGRGR